MIRSACKRILPLILVLLVLMTFPMDARAAGGEFDLHKTGAIRVHLQDLYDPEQSVGGTLCLLQVGIAQESDHNLTFRLTPEFADSGISLREPGAAGLARQLADYAVAHNCEGVSIAADETGTVRFADLAMGLYLVIQTETAQGWMTMDLFLVSLPMYSEDAGGWLYTVEATPKLQRIPGDPVSLTVVKKWKDNEKNRPEELTVLLLQDGKTAETVVLTDEKQWKHTWKELDSAYHWSVEEVVPEGYTASYSLKGSTITITNIADWYEEELIQTGQLYWPVPVLACAGLALLVAGIWLIRRGKQEA